MIRATSDRLVEPGKCAGDGGAVEVRECEREVPAGADVELRGLEVEVAARAFVVRLGDRGARGEVRGGTPRRSTMEQLEQPEVVEDDDEHERWLGQRIG